MKLRIISKDNYGAVKKLEKAFGPNAAKSADICIAIGGDGTFVLAASQFDGPILPIRGNERGSAGFYADVSVADIDKVIRLLKSGSYYVDTLSRKLVALHAGNRSYAVNEVALKSAEEEVYFSVYNLSDGKRTRVYPFVMSGDGMLVTGEVGSTAYNKSADGPIMLTDKVMCLTFLNCDGPYKNPIVLDADSSVEVVVEKWDALLKCDNKVIARLTKGSSFSVKMSDKTVRIIRLRGMEEPTHRKLKRLIMRKMVDGVQ